MRKAKFGGYIWLLPLVFFLLTIELWPFLQMLHQSFHHLSFTQPTLNGEFAGLGNYRKAMNSESMMSSIGLTLKYMLIALPLEVLLAIFFSVLLSYHLKLKKYVLPILLIPMILAPIVVGLSAKLNLNPDFGIIGIFLKNLGISPSGLLTSANTAFLTIIVVDIWQWTPFLIMIFLASILAMPKEPFEAALIDGADRFQIFRYLTLPFLTPIIIIGILLRLTDAYKLFDQVYIMTGGGPGSSTELLTIFAYKLNFKFWNLGYGSAAVAILFLISFIISFFFVKLTYKEEAS
jgi:multiple sugar transport system permease protein|tara:strand:- start:1063 stop:1935 length:873 start_codon:yes stop_codon:yes gene_type:complete